MKTLKEQIAVMQYFADNGAIEKIKLKGECRDWFEPTDKNIIFDWQSFDYRIKKEKQTITIEKWLCEYEGCNELRGSKRFFIIEKTVPFDILGKKIKLLDSYEVDIDSTEK